MGGRRAGMDKLAQGAADAECEALRKRAAVQEAKERATQASNKPGGMSKEMRRQMQQLAISANLERTPTDEEYQAIKQDRGSELRKFFVMFKPKEVMRVKAGTMPPTFQVFNVHRMLSEDSTLRHQVGFAFSIGMPSKAMMIPTVWIVTPTGVWIETTSMELDDTAVLLTTKDPVLEQLLENWFQTSRRGTSSQIKNVAMIPYHPHHISVDKFLENRENLLVTRIDRPMRTVKVNIDGVDVTTTVPAEEATGVTKTCDLHTEMDETISDVKADVYQYT